MDEELGGKKDKNLFSSDELKDRFDSLQKSLAAASATKVDSQHPALPAAGTPEFQALESKLAAPVKNENATLRQFESDAVKIIKTKKNAQMAIFIAVKELRGMKLSHLLVPENLLQFETAFDEISKKTNSIKEEARKYSLCVKIFINIFLHEAQAIKSVDTREIIATVQQQERYIEEAEESFESCFEDIYKELQELSKRCQNEVERFAQTGAIARIGETRVLLAQTLADFIVAYEEINKIEADTFKHVNEFLKKNEKALKLANENAHITMKMLNANKTDIKDVWVRYEPHVKLWHTILFLCTIATFTSLGLEFGILKRVKVFSLFNRIFAGAKLSSATYVASHFPDIRELAGDLT